jgi:predicted transcriptional regulator
MSQNIKETVTAKIQPRIHSAPKTKLEDVVPLQTPFSVHIDICSLCNFKCSFCFQADIYGKKEKNFPDDIPRFPDHVYGKNFEGWGVFLGTGNVHTKDFISYNNAKKHALSLKLKSGKEWKDRAKSSNFPKDIPKDPATTYKKQFEGWGIFLGTGNVRTKDFISYKDAKKYALSLKLKSREEWKDHKKSSNFPKDIPKDPQNTYKKQFEGWGDFLGTSRKPRSKS